MAALRAIDVLTATDRELVDYALQWIDDTAKDEAAAAEDYGTFATLLEEAAGRFEGLRALAQLLRGSAITIGTIQTDELKHHSALVRLHGEFDRYREFGGKGGP